MNIQDQYFIVVGTVRGVLGSTNCKKGQAIKYELNTDDNVSEITALHWGRTENEIIIGYKEGTLKLYNCQLNKYTKTVDILKGKGAVVGVAPLGRDIIVGRYNGIINIWSKTDNHSIPLNLQEGSTLECMTLNESRINVVGTGGNKNDFKLWDIETKQCIFKAKSLAHDNLNLPIPTSIRSICYFPTNEKLSACATKEGYVLLYDERAQRRPVLKFIEPKASYTVIANTFKDRQCLVGTTKGYLQLIDLKLPTRCLKTFKSFTGSVTDIAYDPGKSIVATTSLDRFLRIHDLETKELLHKEYLKQSLTKLILRPKIKEEADENINTLIVNENNEENVTENVEDVDEEYEDIFRNMETITENVKRKNTEKIKKKKLKTS
ncbi:WD repeat-containing protein 74 [Agrilus planipennis]|uniref:WD repeat-containing protein 74 n=1 Tax=Agrilus planipennis TaxID=224129 RepID=A0A1W4WIC4_AGRPL|nr:WD repeat-containing protein 74 [Agrilus planipennis]